MRTDISLTSRHVANRLVRDFVFVSGPAAQITVLEALRVGSTFVFQKYIVEFCSIISQGNSSQEVRAVLLLQV